MAQGFQEVLDEDYLHYRIRSVAYLGEHLLAAGVQIVEPPGGHAIYIDAAGILPAHPAGAVPRPGAGLRPVPPRRHPGRGDRQRHVRRCRSGDGRDRAGRRMELVRLAIPRRVYTQSHIDYVIEAITELYQQRHTIRGLRIVEAPAVLRHFTAKFAEIESNCSLS